MADVRKNTDESRYEVYVGGELAGIQDYRVVPHGEVAIPHTKVEDRFSGQGLAGELTRFALDDIRSQGYKVDPQCPYVKDWIDKNPGYADLVASDETIHRNIAGTMEDVTGVNPVNDQRI